MIGVDLELKRLRGVGYIPATTQGRDHVQGMLSAFVGAGPNRRPNPPLSRFRYPPGLPVGGTGQAVPFGQFVPEMVEQELRFLRGHGFNNIRFYGSFLGWLVGGQDYVNNLQSIRDTCGCLGMTITFKVWNGSVTVDPLLNDAFGALQALGNAGVPSVRDAIQLVSDWMHLRLVSNVHGPLPGTHFFSGPWSDPGTARLIEPPSRRPPPPSGDRWDRWNGLFPFLESARGRRVPLGDLMVQYVKDVASVFRGSPVLFSYDLFNEVDGLYDRNLHSLFSVVDFIHFTHSVLAATHGRFRSTVGLATPRNLVDVYFALLSLQVPGLVTYASFHDFESRAWDGQARAYYDKLETIRARIGLPLVISEFYVPEHPHVHNRGKLGVITRHLESRGISGQMWAVMESNWFALDAARRWVPGDGMYFTTDPPTGVYTNPPQFAPPTLRRAPSYVADQMAMHAWARGPVTPPQC